METSMQNPDGGATVDVPTAIAMRD